MKILHAVALVIVASACSDTRNTPDSSAETVADTVNGVVHVRSSGHPADWTAIRIARIGSAEGGPAAFGRIRSVIADAAGNIYVADNLASEIRVFSPDGEHLRTMGRRGAGPGEFGDLYSLAWIGQNLAAMDPRNARIAVLSTAGEWIDGIRHYPITGSATLVRLYPLDSTGFYTPVISKERDLPFVRITAAGATDTIRAPQIPEGARRTGVMCHRPDGGITGISVPDAPALAYAFVPPGGAVAVSWTESYRVAVINARGDTVRIVTREQPPIPYSDSVWEQALKPYHELHQNFPGSRCEPDALSRPQARAALRHIVFDGNGDMWVESASETGFRWDVFDPEGRLIAQAEAPPRARIPPYVRDRRLYQVEEDSLGVQYVGVYHLRPAR